MKSLCSCLACQLRVDKAFIMLINHLCDLTLHQILNPSGHSDMNDIKNNKVKVCISVRFCFISLLCGDVVIKSCMFPLCEPSWLKQTLKTVRNCTRTQNSIYILILFSSAVFSFLQIPDHGFMDRLTNPVCTHIL